MTETPLDDTERALIVISLEWMRFGGSRRGEIFEWLVEKMLGEGR